MKEKWSKGKHAGCVVSDAPNPHGDNGGTEYYGGYLVAESIPKQEYVNLIAAAPDLKQALYDILYGDWDNRIPDKLFKAGKAALDKSEGRL